MHLSRIAVLVVVGLALLAPAARAQFPGDFFLGEPFVSVEEGSTVTLEVRAFGGATAVGAVRFDFTFDPQELEIQDVLPAETPQLDGTFTTLAVPGRVSVVILNGRSLTAPIGSLDLARITVRPLVAAGATVNVAVSGTEMLDTASAPFASSMGFSGGIVVTSAGSSMMKAEAVQGLEPTPQEVALALSARPAGHVVTVLQPVRTSGGWGVRAKAVETRDLTADHD